MSKLSKRLKLTVAVIVAGLLVAAVAPLVSELYRIGKVRDQYRLDNAVYSEIVADPVHKPTAEYVLDPPFMKRYGLSSKDYLDAKGYFAPTGVHWSKWSLETRTAAVLMWRQDSGLSAWKIRHTLRLIDDYYSRNDQTTPIVEVVKATSKL